MEISQIIPHIEALIFASDKPLSSAEVTELVNNAMGFIEDRATQEQVDAALEGICEKYNAEFYPFEVKESGGGWQFLTKKAYYKTVGQLNGDKFLKRLSNAALETLAIIAYKQPITKSEIEAIRGVNCDYAVQKLLEKDLIVITGRKEDAVGHPLLYATSKSFMDYFGINSPEELPKISEVMMDELVQATMVNQQGAEEEENGTPMNNPATEEEQVLTIATDEASEEEATIPADDTQDGQGDEPTPEVSEEDTIPADDTQDGQGDEPTPEVSEEDTIPADDTQDGQGDEPTPEVSEEDAISTDDTQDGQGEDPDNDSKA